MISMVLQQLLSLQKQLLQSNTTDHSANGPHNPNRDREGAEVFSRILTFPLPHGHGSDSVVRIAQLGL